MHSVAPILALVSAIAICCYPDNNLLPTGR